MISNTQYIDVNNPINIRIIGNMANTCIFPKFTISINGSYPG